MGLRLRLILIVILPALVVLGAHGYVRVQQEKTQLYMEDERNIALATRGIQIAVENALRDRQITDVKRLLSEMAEQQEGIERIRLFDRTATPTLSSNPETRAAPSSKAILQQVMETGEPVAEYERRGPRLVLTYVVPLRGRQGAIVGAMEIQHVAQGISQRTRAAANDVWLRMAILLGVIVLMSGVALQREVLRPLSLLLDGIRRLARGEAGPPIPIARRDELSEVAQAFNEMAAQLDAARLRLMAESERGAELEHQLRQAETLAVAGKLASAIAHEVGTPLNIISGRAEFVLKTAELDAAARKDLETIGTQIDRISGIIRSLLDSVRPREPEIHATPLAEILDRALPLLRHPARRRQVTLRTQIADDLPPMAADAGQLQQVLINLVVNAIDATATGGEVEVSARRASVRERPGVSVSVRDTGPGIAAELLPRVFEPFFTTKPAGRGTGLGLAICRDIVKAHGGELRVESEEGRGTTFTAWIPADEGEPRAPHPTPTREA
jgi:two-component system NtrC family sensor kinase